MRERDFFKERLTETELRDLLKGTKAAEAFAWRSPRAKSTRLDPDNPLPDGELVRLMLEVPYLLKRPVIHIGDETVFGFDKKRLEDALARV